MTTPYPGNALWPTDWDKATFHGKLIDILGAAPANAAIYIKPNVTTGVITSIGSDVAVMPVERKIPVNPVTSEFTVDIPATDDPQVSPTGWTYQVRVSYGIAGIPDLTFNMTAPVGTTVEFKTAAAAAGITANTGVPIITAYQYAKSKGYAGSEDDFAIKMNSTGTGGISIVTDSVVASNAAIALSKTADSAASGGRLAMTTAERTAIAAHTTQLSGKADLAGAAFTGAVTVPVPSAAANPVRLDQVNAGIVQMDSFAGATDAAKLQAAMTYAAAQSKIPWIQLPARTIDTGSTSFALYSGCKIMGAGANVGPKNLEVGTSTGQLVPGQWNTSAGSTTGALLQSTSQMYDVNLSGIAFYSTNGNTQIIRSTANLYACEFHNLTFFGCKGAIGVSTEKALLTQVLFTGHWTCLAGTDVQFYMGGSDNQLWMSGYLNIGSQTPVSGKMLMNFNWMQKSNIGLIYVTATNDWGGIQVDGTQDYGIKIFGGIWEGLSPTTLATRPLLTVLGGCVDLFGPHLGQVSDSAGTVNGAIHQSGGLLTMYSPTYQRGSATAATFPLLYQTGGVAQVYHPRAAVSGETPRVRWSTASVVAATAPANLLTS